MMYFDTTAAVDSEMICSKIIATKSRKVHQSTKSGLAHEQKKSGEFKVPSGTFEWGDFFYFAPEVAQENFSSKTITGQLVISAHNRDDNNLIVWDLKTKQSRFVLSAETRVKCVAFVPGAESFVTCFDGTPREKIDCDPLGPQQRSENPCNKHYRRQSQCRKLCKKYRCVARREITVVG